MRKEYDFSKMKKRKTWHTPRNLSIVRFTLSKKFGKFYEKAYPFKADREYVFLGEIPNIPGHCIVTDFKANSYIGEPLFYIGYSTDVFEEIPSKVEKHI